MLAEIHAAPRQRSRLFVCSNYSERPIGSTSEMFVKDGSIYTPQWQIAEFNRGRLYATLLGFSFFPSSLIWVFGV